MKDVTHNVSVALDDKTKEKLDDYGEKYALSRSAVIRMIVNNFFLHQDGN